MTSSGTASTSRSPGSRRPWRAGSRPVRPPGEPVPVADVAASFQEAVCDVLVRKALDAAGDRGIEDLLIGGGVAANSRLRAMAVERAEARGVRVRVPAPGPVHRQRRHGRRPRRRARRPRAPAVRARPPRRLLDADHHVVRSARWLRCEERQRRASKPPPVRWFRGSAWRPSHLNHDGERQRVSKRQGTLSWLPFCGAIAYSIAPSTFIRTIDHWPSWKRVNRTWVSSSQTALL